ncbi:type II secretion system F family protein [Candidatus Babeliales bacterium]|nr:type II secretion system F family protein [Candidatus Babeliales bacterium]MBY0353557.1 type II secretion system F family protein [Candidatus Babeliales bacterium]
MPTFFWKGIDAHGNNQHGYHEAVTPEALKKELLDRQIALLSYAKKKPLFSFLHLSRTKLAPQELERFFATLALLLESGIDLAHALELVAKQTSNQTLKGHAQHLIKEITCGNSFSHALEQTGAFSPFIINAVKAGQAAGKLSDSFYTIVAYLQQRIQLTKKLKQAALLPGITLTFALLIVGCIMIFIIPQFQELFTSTGKELPPLTRHIIALSSFLRAPAGLLVWLSIPGFIALTRLLLKLERVKTATDWLVARTPFVRKIWLYSNLIYSFQMISMLLKSGTTLSQALTVAQQAAQHGEFKHQLELISTAITQGKSFEKALKQSGTRYFPDDVIAFVSTGEQTGKLALMLDKMLIALQTQLARSLHILTVVANPLLLILVGIIITILMLSIYLPIFNLASTL